MDHSWVAELSDRPRTVCEQCGGGFTEVGGTACPGPAGQPPPPARPPVPGYPGPVSRREFNGVQYAVYLAVIAALAALLIIAGAYLG